MRRVFLILALLVGLAAPVPVQAQSEQHIAMVSVNLWPEYDQPAVLVIYHILLAPETSLPATLVLKIPSQAQINAVAVSDEVGGLLNAPYDRSVDGAWATLSITVNSLHVQVEYYDVLEKADTNRHIVFEWGGGNAVDALEVNFLAPHGASEVRISPAPAGPTPGQDNLMNYRLQASSLAAQDTFNVVIDYQRSSDELSIASLPVEAATTPGVDTPGRLSLTSVLPWILGGLGVLLVVAGVVGFFVWQSGGREALGRRRHAARPAAVESEIYCHQCGKRAQPGDTFCRTCGTRLRSE